MLTLWGVSLLTALIIIFSTLFTGLAMLFGFLTFLIEFIYFVTEQNSAKCGVMWIGNLFEKGLRHKVESIDPTQGIIGKLICTQHFLNSLFEFIVLSIDKWPFSEHIRNLPLNILFFLFYLIDYDQFGSSINSRAGKGTHFAGHILY